MKKAERKRGPLKPTERNLQKWCSEAGIGYSTFFTIPLELRPHAAKVGRRIIPTENPDDWLKRIAAAGGIPSRRPA